MKLSMSMIAARLEKHAPLVEIVDDHATIEGLRVFPAEQLPLSGAYVYLARFGQLQDDGSERGSFLITHDQSSIVVEGCAYQELLNDLLAAFDYYNSWETSLLEAAAAHAPVHEMLDIAAPAMGNSAFVANVSGAIIATSDISFGFPEDRFMHEVRDTGFITVDSISRPLFFEDGSRTMDFDFEPAIIHDKIDESYDFIGTYLDLDRERIVALTVELGNARYAQLDLELSRYLLRSLKMAAEFESGEGLLRSKASVLNELLKGKEVSHEELERTLDVTHGAIGGPQGSLPADPSPRLWRLAVFEHAFRKDATIVNVLVHTLRVSAEGCVAVEFEGNAVALVPEGSCDELLVSRSEELGLACFAVGLSLPFQDARTMPLRLRQARFALKQGDGSGVHRADDYALDYLLERLRTYDAGLELRHPALDILHAYDEAHDGELYETLYQYLRLGRNLTHVSELLCIHRNSLAYRLERIAALTGVTLDNADENVHLLVSFLLDGADGSASAGQR